MNRLCSFCRVLSKLSHLWLEFGVGSCLTLRVFLQVPQFTSLQHSIFQFDQDRGPAGADVAFSLNITIYLNLNSGSFTQFYKVEFSFTGNLQYCFLVIAKK